MIKHVGRHNEKKVAIVFKTLPNDPSHALVVYSDTLPSFIHDGLMAVLESNNGQSAKELADELDKHTMADGRNVLAALHTDGYLTKVETRHVIVEANSKSGVRLDELNKMLGEMNTTGIKSQAQDLLRRANAMLEEAYQLDPSLRPIPSVEATEEVTYVAEAEAEAPKKRGRPKKETA
jgi:predicted ArsR family transcriptional regulator